MINLWNLAILGGEKKALLVRSLIELKSIQQSVTLKPVMYNDMINISVGPKTSRLINYSTKYLKNLFEIQTLNVKSNVTYMTFKSM